MDKVPFLRQLRGLNNEGSHYSDYGGLPSRHPLRKTFGPNGLRRPPIEELLPDLATLEKSFADNVQLFLTRYLKESPTDANYLSEHLHTSEDIIKEAQRLHFNIIYDAIKSFKYAMLFDIAAFENKGDPCITVGEVYFLARVGIELVYYCGTRTCSQDNIAEAAVMAKRYNPKDLVILLHGGGNIALYVDRDRVKFKILPLFTSYSIVIFPQSVSIYGVKSEHISKCRQFYCCNPNMTIFLRDRISYDNAVRLFNGSTKLAMAPDMAFQIGHMQRLMSPVFDIMWIQRQDREAIGFDPVSDFRGYKVHVSDWTKWLTPKGSNSMEQAFYTAFNGFFYLQRGRVLVTDRLHGHILATLMDIPHVLIDNQAQKISRYHNTWTRSLTNTAMTTSPEEALDLAIGLLKKYNATLPPRVPFLSLSEDHKPYSFGQADSPPYP